MQVTRLWLALVLMTTLSWGEFTWPTQSTPVIIADQAVTVDWREGRPFVCRSQVARLLKMPEEGEEQIDLIQACEQQQARIRQKADGTIDILVPTFVQARRGDSQQARRFKAELNADRRAKALQPKLVVVQSNTFIADTEFIRAVGTVQNQGGSPSDPCWVVGHFVDWYGKPFTKPDPWPLRSLQPGQSASFEFFSSVHHTEKNLEKGSKYRCDITFQRSTPAEIEAAIQRK